MNHLIKVYNYKKKKHLIVKWDSVNRVLTRAKQRKVAKNLAITRVKRGMWRPEAPAATASPQAATIPEVSQIELTQPSSVQLRNLRHCNTFSNLICVFAVHYNRWSRHLRWNYITEVRRPKERLQDPKDHRSWHLWQSLPGTAPANGANLRDEVSAEGDAHQNGSSRRHQR